MKIYKKVKFKNVKEAEEFINQFKLDLISLIPEITLLDVQDNLNKDIDTDLVTYISAKKLAELLNRN